MTDGKLGDKTGDKPGNKLRKADMGDKPRKDRRQAGRQAKTGGHSIPDQMGDKTGNKTGAGDKMKANWGEKSGDKMGHERKTNAARRTQHYRQGGHIKKTLHTLTLDCLGKTG